MSKKVLLLLIIIISLAAFLRFYKLSEVPPGINRDESSIGFTAYSLLKTGKDEYGRPFPVSFQSFGDWKLPLYIYSVVPLVSLLGLNEWAVRLPSAFFGTLTVLITFLLVRELFSNRGPTLNKMPNNTEIIALLTSFLVAIAPWHLHLSRVESESNTAVFFIALATLLFLKSVVFSSSISSTKGGENKRSPFPRGERDRVKVKTWLLIPSAILFALSYFTYAGNHVFTSLLVLGLLFLYRKEIPKTKITAIAAVLFLLLSGFLFYHTLVGADKTKLSGINILGDPAVVHLKIELLRNEHQNPQSVLSILTHNKILFAAERIVQNYLNAFSPEFLFIKGGENHAHNILNFGNMYLVEAPFLFLGFIYLLTVLKGKEKLLIVWWFLIAPIAASITKDAPHTNRMFAIFPMLPLVTALGIYWLVAVYFRNKSYRLITVGIVIVLFMVNFVIYMDRYYIHFPRDEVAGWGNGYKELNKVLISSPYNVKHIIMNKPEYSPYSFLLFYQQYDPSTYQKESISYPITDDGFVHVKEFGRYEFRDIDWGQDTQRLNTLLIDQTNQVPEFVKNTYPVKEIKLPNGKPMFTIVESIPPEQRIATK